MDNLAICKKIAEIDGIDVFEDRGLHGFQLTRKDSYEAYNPLTDDALCFQLMVKYRITVEFTRYYEILKSTTVKAFYDTEADNGYGAYIRDSNPNKAILLAIIEAYKN